MVGYFLQADIKSFLLFFAIFLDYFQIRIRRAAHNGLQGLDYLLVADDVRPLN